MEIATDTEMEIGMAIEEKKEADDRERERERDRDELKDQPLLGWLAAGWQRFCWKVSNYGWFDEMEKYFSDRCGPLVVTCGRNSFLSVSKPSIWLRATH